MTGTKEERYPKARPSVTLAAEPALLFYASLVIKGQLLEVTNSENRDKTRYPTQPVNPLR